MYYNKRRKKGKNRHLKLFFGLQPTPCQNIDIIGIGTDLRNFISFIVRYQTLAVATDANTKEDIGNKKVSGKKLTVIVLKEYRHINLTTILVLHVKNLH